MFLPPRNPGESRGLPCRGNPVVIIFRRSLCNSIDPGFRRGYSVGEIYVIIFRPA